MRLSFILQVSLTVMILVTALCMALPTASAGNVESLDWTSPTTNTLVSVFMVSASDGWAVGAAGAAIHWNGFQWSSVTGPTAYWLYSVFMVSANDGWAVGDYGTIIRWEGVQWMPEFPSLIILSLFMIVTLLGSIVYRKKRLARATGLIWLNFEKTFNIATFK